MVKYLYLFVFIFSNYLYAQNLDINILKYINQHRSHKLDPFMLDVSASVNYVSLGSTTFLFINALVKQDSLNYKRFTSQLGSLFISTVITTSLKHLVRRERPFVTYPYLEHSGPAGSFSFPSGHTSMAFATATSLSLEYKKWYVCVPAFTFASVIAYSRLHLGVHYPSDVVVGGIVGVGSAYVSYKLNQLFYTRLKSKK